MSVEWSDAFNETPLPESIPGEQMLYVFHVQLKKDIVYDTSGLKSPNVQSAWSTASQSARELVAEAVRFGQDIDFESILAADTNDSPAHDISCSS